MTAPHMTTRLRLGCPFHGNRVTEEFLHNDIGVLDCSPWRGHPIGYVTIFVRWNPLEIIRQRSQTQARAVTIRVLAKATILLVATKGVAQAAILHVTIIQAL